MLIHAYQWIGKTGLIPLTCRYYPSCSNYAMDAVRRYGAVKGSLMTMARLFRCHPGNPGGLDPVP